MKSDSKIQARKKIEITQKEKKGEKNDVVNVVKESHITFISDQINM